MLASICAVYGPLEHQSIFEGASTCPINPYGASKLTADQVVAGFAATGDRGDQPVRAEPADTTARTADRDATRVLRKMVAPLRGKRRSCTSTVTTGAGQ